MRIAMNENQKVRHVDWPSILGAAAKSPVWVANATMAGSVSVLSAVDELAAYRDLDTVLRRAVEVARDRFGLERVSIYLRDEASRTMRGSWGTGAFGETTDERSLCYEYGDTDAEVQRRVDSEVGRWLLLQDAPQIAHRDGESFALGSGWIVVTPIRSERRDVGVIFNDSAFSNSPIDEEKQARLAVFGRLLGNVIDARMRSTDLPAMIPAAVKFSPLVRRAALALRSEPALSGAELAGRLGVSAGHLARRFKAEMAVSLVEYRNRLRIERFFEVVDQGGERLLSAALAAGFGSYAQFHRVFCRMVGTTPSEYLTGKVNQEAARAAASRSSDAIRAEADQYDMESSRDSSVQLTASGQGSRRSATGADLNVTDVPASGGLGVAVASGNGGATSCAAGLGGAVPRDHV